MKTFTLVTLTAMTLMLSGCKDESVDFGGNGDGGDPQTETGYLVMSAMSVTVADDAEVIPYSNGTKAAMTRAAGSVSEAPDNYKVSIRNAKTGEQTNHAYCRPQKSGKPAYAADTGLLHSLRRIAGLRRLHGRRDLCRLGKTGLRRFGDQKRDQKQRNDGRRSGLHAGEHPHDGNSHAGSPEVVHVRRRCRSRG